MVAVADERAVVVEVEDGVVVVVIIHGQDDDGDAVWRGGEAAVAGVPMIGDGAGEVEDRRVGDGARGRVEGEAAGGRCGVEEVGEGAAVGVGGGDRLGADAVFVHREVGDQASDRGVCDGGDGEGNRRLRGAESVAERVGEAVGAEVIWVGRVAVVGNGTVDHERAVLRRGDDLGDDRVAFGVFGIEDDGEGAVFVERELARGGPWQIVDRSDADGEPGRGGKLAVIDGVVDGGFAVLVGRRDKPRHGRRSPNDHAEREHRFGGEP